MIKRALVRLTHHRTFNRIRIRIFRNALGEGYVRGIRDGYQFGFAQGWEQRKNYQQAQQQSRVKGDPRVEEQRKVAGWQ